MMQKKKKFEFVGVVEEVRFNLVNTAVFLPHHVIVDIPRGRPRVSGIINGIPFSLCIQYRKEVGRFFSINSALRQAAGIEAGDPVKVFFTILDMNKVEIPDALETVLSVDDQAKRAWRKLSGNIKRNLSDYISSAKGFDSRIKRSIETVQKAKLALVPLPGKKKNPARKKGRNKKER